MKSDVRKRKGGEDTLNERSSTSDARRTRHPCSKHPARARSHSLTHSVVFHSIFFIMEVPDFHRIKVGEVNLGVRTIIYLLQMNVADSV